MPTAKDTIPRLSQSGIKEASLDTPANPWKVLAKLLVDSKNGLTVSDLQAWRVLFGSDTIQVPQTEKWMLDPKQLGILFLSPTIESGINAARDDVWHFLGKTYSKFSHLSLKQCVLLT